MAQLAAIAYANERTALEAMGALECLQRECPIELDAVAALVRHRDGELKLVRAPTILDSTGGSVWGGLFGLLFLSPFAGLPNGICTSRSIGRYFAYGLDDQFARELCAALQPGTSAFLVFTGTAIPERAIAELEPFGGRVLCTSMPQARVGSFGQDWQTHPGEGADARRNIRRRSLPG
jgi:uncharacterized membrane protein